MAHGRIGSCNKVDTSYGEFGSTWSWTGDDECTTCFLGLRQAYGITHHLFLSYPQHAWRQSQTIRGSWLKCQTYVSPSHPVLATRPSTNTLMSMPTANSVW